MVNIIDYENKFRQDSTDKVIEIINFVKDNMPKEATHMEVFRKCKRGINSLGIGYDYYETYCNYYNDVGVYHESKYFEPMLLGYEKVKTIKVCGDIRWQKEYSINYILYEEGLYRPHDEEKLKSLKQHYYNEIDAGIIYPINDLYSDDFKFRKACETIINDYSDSEVNLIFILDYEFAENRWEKHLKSKKEYAVKGKLICDDIEIETDFYMDTKVWILFDKVKTTLNKYGIDKITIGYEMEDEDRDKMLSHHRWGGCTWD